MTTPGPKQQDEERYARGLRILRRIGGEDYDGPIKRVAQISPDLSRFTVEYPYGDILSRPGLDLPVRQLCTVAMLIADGSAQPQLKFHMAGFINAGGEPSALVELLFLAVAILGFPAAINSVGLVREVFQEQEIAFEPLPPATDDGRERGRRGRNALTQLIAGDVDGYLKGFEETSPDLARLWVAFAFGEALSRDSLDVKTKSLAVIAMLATAGNRTDALRLHLAGALAQGVSQAQIIELLMQLSVYRGFPSALNAFAVASEVFGAGTDRHPHVPALALTPPMTTDDSAPRLAQGRATLARTSGASGDAVVSSFNDLAPDLGRMIVEHSYGEVFCRDGIDMKTRELSACAALAAVATKSTETPLRVHINAALNVGARPEEIVEILLNLVCYSGYPAVQRAVRIAGEEFARRERPAGPEARPIADKAISD